MKLTQEMVRKFIDYDPSTGDCWWKERDKHLFTSEHWKSDNKVNAWNLNFAGKKIKSFCKNGYKRICINSKSYYLHRIIWFYMTGEWPNVIDHINGDPADNRWKNLRNVSQHENTKNQRLRSNNKSGIKGVCFVKSRNKWLASITINGKSKYLGIFDCIPYAVRARKEAEKELNYSSRW